MANKLLSFESLTADLPQPEEFAEGARLKFVGNKFKVNQNFETNVKNQYCFGVDVGGYRPTYFASNVKNEQQALWARVLKKQTTPGPLMEYFKIFFKDNLRKFLPYRRLRPDSIEFYLHNSNAAPGVKKKIKEAWGKLSCEGVTGETELSKELLYKYTIRKSFVKVENLSYGTPIGNKEKAPRLIQGASPEFIALVGPYFSAFQRYMKNQWNKNNFLYFTSGANNKDMGEFFQVNPDWEMFENDVSAWDASFSLALCELEVWVAKKFGAPRVVLDLMQANIRTHGVTTNGWIYSCMGTRKSGDPYTSCFNSLFNAMLHLFVFHLQTGIPPEHLKDHIRMMVMGDDNLMRHSGPRVQFYDDFIQLGFVTESNYRDDISEVEFCSAIPVPSRQGLVFVPKPGKLMAKFGYFINPPNIEPNTLFYGVCRGFDNLRFIPWYRELVDTTLQALFEKGLNMKQLQLVKVKLRDWEGKMNFSHADWCPDTDAVLQKRYCMGDYLYNRVTQLIRERQMNHNIMHAVYDRETDGPKMMYTN